VEAIVAGVGMIEFSKPGRSDPYDVMGARAAHAALTDAGLDYADIQQAYVGYVYGDSTSGQSALYNVGLSGVPIVNVNNNCSTGSTALFLARQAVASGVVDVALALGFEQMTPGPLKRSYTDRTPTTDKHRRVMEAVQGWHPDAPPAAQYFGGAGLEYQQRYGAADATFAKISVKARRHAFNNPLAIFREPLTEEEIMASPHIFGPLTRLQCCPPTCGAAAAVVVSPAFYRRRGLSNGIGIRAQALTSDRDNSFNEGSMMAAVGYHVSEAAAAQVYAAAGVGPEDVDLVELHDCFTANELITYEALGLTPEGTAERFICDGDNSYGGRVVTNPSGGLLSKGHPLGATGLAQCSEIVWQLRGRAGRRQVEGARIGLQHNLGLGSACVVTMFERL
jgi:acetyl-CoA acetyltransferase